MLGVNLPLFVKQKTQFPLVRVQHTQFLHNLLSEMDTRTADRPVQDLDSSVKSCCCHGCSMWFIVVLMKYSRSSLKDTLSVISVLVISGRVPESISDVQERIRSVFDSVLPEDLKISIIQL